MEKTKKPEALIPAKSKKRKNFVVRGQVHIQATYNNTIVTVTDMKGNVLVWSSAGRMGFKGPKKSTPYAAGIVVKNLMDKVREFGLKDLDILVKGVGSGREASIRAFNVPGINITSIKDVTPIPHNGPRPKRLRRV